MERTSKRGSAATRDADSDCDNECPVCLEPFGSRVRRRTVARGVPERAEKVFPFECGHALCVGCDGKMCERGDGRCPLCRAERTEPLGNDQRNDSGDLIFQVAGSLSLPQRTSHDALDEHFYRRIAEDARNQSAHARQFVREMAEQLRRSSGEETARQGVPLSHGARQLVAALANITRMSLQDFRSSASVLSQERPAEPRPAIDADGSIAVGPHTEAPGYFDGASPSLLLVRRVRPSRW